MLTPSWLAFAMPVGQTAPMIAPSSSTARLPSGLLGLALGLVLATTASAASLVGGSLTSAPEPGASLWSAGLHSGVRLLDGGAGEDPAHRLAGLEIRLDPHFKTYWRTPGDSGLPPVFDWSGSQNVRSVDVAWPAPTRFEDSAGSSIGYKDRLVLPLTVTPEDPAKPVTLDLRMDYAVCEQVCIPAHAEPRLALGTARLSTPQASRVAEALAAVPARQALSVTAVPGIRSVAPAKDGTLLTVVAQVPETKGLVDIFTEGPDGWTFSAPLAVGVEALPGGGHRLTYKVKVDSRPAGGTLAGLPLTLTMVAGEDALEVATRLDAAAPPP